MHPTPALRRAVRLLHPRAMPPARAVTVLSTVGPPWVREVAERSPHSFEGLGLYRLPYLADPWPWLLLRVRRRPMRPGQVPRVAVVGLSVDRSGGWIVRTWAQADPEPDWRRWSHPGTPGDGADPAPGPSRRRAGARSVRGRPRG